MWMLLLDKPDHHAWQPGKPFASSFLRRIVTVGRIGTGGVNRRWRMKRRRVVRCRAPRSGEHPIAPSDSASLNAEVALHGRAVSSGIKLGESGKSAERCTQMNR